MYFPCIWNNKVFVFVTDFRNVALYKSVYTDPPGINLRYAVDGNLDNEARTGNRTMSFISVDLRSRYAIEDVYILIEPVGKLSIDVECEN